MAKRCFCRDHFLVGTGAFRGSGLRQILLVSIDAVSASWRLFAAKDDVDHVLPASGSNLQVGLCFPPRYPPI
jgi:hypothetical protein